MKNLKGNMHKKLFALAILSFCELAGAQTSAHWVGTWAASPLSQTVNSGQPAPGNSTYRNIVHISMGGSSFLFTCLAIGIILSVARNAETSEGKAAGKEEVAA